MSTSMAIAAVTTILQSLISNRVAAEPIASIIGSVNVTTLPPDRISLTGNADPDQINIFLHQIGRNSGWANVELPSRNTRGERVSNPPLVVDLHYLLSVYGSKPFFAELLLGQIMQVLHEQPVMSRTIIERALSPASPPADFPLELAESGIADQFEKIRITPETLNTEEISKLWSAMQARFRPTLAYKVTTLIIESDHSARPALPVRRRLGYGVTLGAPVITGVYLSDDPKGPIVSGAAIDIVGYRLLDETMIITLNGIDVTALASETNDTKIVLELPTPMVTGLYSGVTSVQIIHQYMMSDPESLHRGQESNIETFMIRPTVTASVAVSETEIIDSETYLSGTLTCTVDPRIARRQSVSVLLNQYNPPASLQPRAYQFKAPDGNGLEPEVTDTATVEIAFSRVVSGDYLLRIQVDGAESLLSFDSSGYFDQPRISL